MNATGPSRRVLIRWELVYVPLEMAAVTFGLWLGMARDDWGSAGAVLFAVCVAGFAARFAHYGRLRLAS